MHAWGFRNDVRSPREQFKHFWIASGFGLDKAVEFFLFADLGNPISPFLCELPEAPYKVCGNRFYDKDNVEILGSAEVKPLFLQLPVTGTATNEDILISMIFKVVFK